MIRYLVLIPLLLLSYGGISQSISASGPVSFCAGGSVTLSVSPTTGITGYQWIKDGANIGGATNITYNATASGSYRVKLNRAAPATDTTLGAIVVTVNPLPVVKVNSPNICVGQSTTLTASGADTYTWSPSAGLNFTTGSVVNANPSSTTIYTVVGRNNTTGCSNSVTSTVTVNPLPVANFTFTPSNQCSSVPVVFTNTSTGGTTYSWDFGDPNSGNNNTSANQNPSHKFVGNPGNGSQSFDVTLTTKSAAGCTATKTLTVTNKQSPDRTLGGTGKTIYNGENYFKTCGTTSGDFTFTNQTTPQNINTNYRIVWGDGSPDFNGTGFVSLNHTFAVGTHPILFIVTGNNGCIDTTRYFAFVGTNPAVGLANPGNTTTCSGESLTFPITGTSTNAPGTIYSVTFNDGSPAITYVHPAVPDSITHIFNNTSCGTTSSNGTTTYNNSFSASILATNPCQSSAATVVPIYVSKKPDASFTISPGDTVCVDKPVSFTNTSLNNFVDNGSCLNGNAIWVVTPATGWTISSGILGNDFGLPDPSVWLKGSDILTLNFTVPGIYTIKIKTGGTKDCGVDEFTKTICVTQKPFPGFTLDNTVGCAPFIITATDTTNTFLSCQNPRYNWTVSYTPAFCGNLSAFTFTNGTSATSANPSFNFTNPGLYTITQNVTNSCGTFTASKTVSIQKPPTVTINLPIYSCGVVKITPSSTVDDCSVNPPTFAWTFADASPATANTANPGNVTFTTLGAHMVTLAVTNDCGTTIDTTFVTVTTTPDVVLPGNDTLCGGLNAGPYNFTSTIGIPVYNWRNSNPSIGLAASGTGNIPAFITVNNSSNLITATIIVIPSLSNCVGIPDTFFVTINPRPSAPIVNASFTYCQNATAATLTGTGTGANAITWYNSLPLTGGSNTAPTPSTATPGTTLYYVTQTNAFNCQGQPSTITINVNAFISGNIISSNQSICANTAPNPLTTSTITGGNGFYNYQWQSSVDGGTVWTNISGGNNSTFAPGILNDTIQYRRIINSTPCADTSNIVTINVAGALSNFNISANEIICQGFAPALLTGQLPSGGGGSYTYQWQTSADNITWNNIIGATGQSYQPAALSVTGFYRRVLTTPQCNATSNVVTITVNPTPVAGIIANAAAICVYDAGSVSFTATVGTAPFAVELVVVKPGGLTDTIRTNINNNGPANILVIPAGSPAGTYAIQFTKLTDSKGCERINILPVENITVKPLPVLVLTNSSPICNGVTAILTASGADTYSWSPDQFINSTSGSTVNVTPLSTTTYTVRGTLNGCIKDSGLLVIVIPGAVVANAGPNQILCNVNSATLAGNIASANATGEWTKVSGPSATITMPSLSNTTVTGLTARGTYVFRWTITGQAPCPPTQSDVTVDVLSPIINTIKNDTIICNGQSLTIRNDSLLGGSTMAIDSVYSFVWESTPAGLTNWQTIAGENAATLLIAPFSSTCYRRKVKTNNLCETTSNMVCVTVNPTINNNSIGTSQQVCVNTPVNNLAGTTPTGGDNVFVYDWQTSTDSVNWNSIATSISYQPSVYTAAGVHYFRRNVSSGNCTSVSNVVTLRIRPDAKAIFTSNPTIACAPFNLANAITVSVLPDSVGTYNWYADGVLFGSNSSGILPAYSIPNPGDTVDVKLVTLSQFGCKPDSMQQQFITVRTAIARFAKDTAGGCGPLNVTFTNTSNIINNGIQFFWDFGNSITSNLAQPGTIAFPTSPFFNDTTYQVTLKAYNGCDTTIWRDSVRVRSNPSARFGVATTFGCSPFTLQVLNTSLGGPNTYYWDFGNGHRDTTLTTGPLSYTYNIGNEVDTFPVRLIAVNECGIDTQTIRIRIAPNLIKPQVIISGSDLFGCAPHTVTFINATTGATTYKWDFGDNTPPVVTNNSQSTIIHTFNNPGTFTIAIAMSNGCSDTTVYREVTVYAKPIASFTTNAPMYCLGDTIRVNNSSLNASNFQWFWGDGKASSDSSPTHVYAVAGNYSITLRADRTNQVGLVCFDTLVRNINVLVKPNAGIQSNSGTVNCAPFIYTASTPGVTNETVTWYINDSTVSPSIIIANGISTQYTFNNPGTFTVKTVAENILGCRDSATQTFTVKGTPVAGFTPLNIAICKTDTTVLHSNTTTYNDNGPLNYRWLVDGVQVTTNGNFTYRYTAPTGSVLPKNFDTWLIATNIAGCSDTAKGSLQMSPTAKAAFGISNPNDCIPFIATITDNSKDASNYQWFVNGNLISNAAAPVISITQAATAYNITLIVSNQYSCRPDTFSINFTSRVMPVAAFVLSDTLGCTGVLNVATTNRSSFANFYTWDWGDNSASSSFVNATHLYNSQGQYLINLIAGDGVCKDTISRMVRVSTKPVADFSPSNTVTCNTAGIQFTNLSVNGRSYLWSFSDGTSSTVVDPFKNFAPSLTPYTVKLVADDGLGCKDSVIKANLITAKVPPAGDFFISPTPVITVPNYTFSLNNLTINSNKYLYQWDLGDGTSASTRDVAFHKYADTGNYPIRLIVLDTSNNCLDTTIRIARIDGFPGWLFVPNAICPNCIQSNLREFIPKGKGLKDYKLQIFTTWGELIFETTALDATGAPTQYWDGRVKGIAVQQDVYVWKIFGRFMNGSEWQGMLYPGEGQYKKTGTITVVR